MTATASDILRDIAPEFNDSSTRQTMLDMAESRTNSTYFGELRPQAVAYRAAHLLCVFNGAALASSGGVSGPITAKSEGDMSVSFGKASSGSQSGNDSSLVSTGYGRALLDMMRSMGPSARVSGFPFVLSPGFQQYGRGY